MFSFPVLMRVNNYTHLLLKTLLGGRGQHWFEECGNTAFLHPPDLHPKSVIPALTPEACSLISALNPIQAVNSNPDTLTSVALVY